MVDLFFFSAHFCVFFSKKKFKVHSLTRLQSLFFFFPPRKKTVFLLTHSIFLQNVENTNLYKKKKR